MTSLTEDRNQHTIAEFRTAWLYEWLYAPRVAGTPMWRGFGARDARLQETRSGGAVAFGDREPGKIGR